ncbi:MAG: hypothetical protein ABIF82_05175 [Planctomycetota bacterium]
MMTSVSGTYAGLWLVLIMVYVAALRRGRPVHTPTLVSGIPEPDFTDMPE